MKSILKYDAVKLICSFCVVWLVFGFITLNLNPLTWSVIGRFVLVTASVGFWRIWVILTETSGDY